MYKKLLITCAFILSNILLFILMMHLGKQPDKHFLFICTRVVLTTSGIMQILIALGFVKLGKGLN